MCLLSEAAPDSFTYAFLLKAAANYKMVVDDRYAVALSSSASRAWWASICWGDFDKYVWRMWPCLFFDEMLEPNFVAWNAAVTASGEMEMARKVFSEMEVKDDVSWSSMTTALTQNGCFDEVFGVFMDLRQLGMIPNQVSLTGVLSACAQLHKLERLSLGELYTVLLRNPGLGLAMHGHGGEAIQLLHEMEESGIKPDRITFVPVLYACSQAGMLD
ncbi:hypothetical protein EZV62_025891 [Acer yangbiense]|uniref:Pentacotripeptide-repeat region of PRORP domain-containing protein n=1 Tax=Acer yangbiense TaxID=1000413 RepID=A0A5C7H157_9ROSI|nr:hypothetical protein EZV62_025891 [Acer yangbiense]